MLSCVHIFIFIQKINLKDVETHPPPRPPAKEAESWAPLGPAEKGRLTRAGQGVSRSLSSWDLREHSTGLWLGQAVFSVYGGLLAGTLLMAQLRPLPQL